MEGDIYEPPSRTTVTASEIFSRDTLLDTYEQAPLDKALKMTSVSSKVVSIIISTSGHAFFSKGIPSIPEMPGKLMSNSKMEGNIVVLDNASKKASTEVHASIICVFYWAVKYAFKLS